MSHHRHREESHANVPYAFTTDDIRRLEEIKRKLSPWPEGRQPDTSFQ